MLSLTPRKCPGLSNRGSNYFQPIFVEAQWCDGTGDGPHLQLPPAKHRFFYELGVDDCQQFKGNLQNWFQNTISLPEDYTTYPGVEDARCWRRHECSGRRKDLRHMVLSLPVVMIIRLNEEYGEQAWNFPKSLLPVSLAEAKDDVVYDLVGLVLFRDSKKSLGHFIARLLDVDGRTVFHYDDMRDGTVIEDPNATARSHLTNKYLALPPGFHVTSAVYRLRGGFKAQDEFFRLRSVELTKKFQLAPNTTSLDDALGLEYLGNMQQMNPLDRIWFFPTKQGSGLEYEGLKHDHKRNHSARSDESPGDVHLISKRSKLESVGIISSSSH